jgi:hypothetical protein
VGNLVDLPVIGGNAAILLAPVLEEVDALKDGESTGLLGIEGEKAAVFLDGFHDLPFEFRVSGFKF